MAQNDTRLPLPIYVAKVTGNAALNAGTQATVAVPPPASVAAWPTNVAVFATVQDTPIEGNVLYTCEVGPITGASISVRVGNVGSVNGAQTWTLFVIAIDLGTVQS